MKFGGRGHILGDQGSACDIALTALRRIVYHYDLNEKLPKLGQAVLRSVQLNEPDDLISWTMEADKDELARLAVTVFEQARCGEAIAKAVIREAAEKLADMAVNCAAHLLPRLGRVQFVLGVVRCLLAIRRQSLPAISSPIDRDQVPGDFCRLAPAR